MRFRAVELHGFVVMPEHVHLLITPAPHVSVGIVLRDLKRRSAIRINAKFGLRGPFWLEGGGYDRNIVTRDEYLEKLNYIHENPVRKGLVVSPTDWNHSSAAYYSDLDYIGPKITVVDTDFRW